MPYKILTFFLSIFIISFFIPQYVFAAYSLNGSTSLSGTTSVAMPITDLQITGTGTEPIPVKLRVTSGTLAMSTTTGLTFDGSSTGSEIYFSGTFTNVNNALATLTYTRGSAGSDTLEVSLVPRGEVFFTDNNHLYKFITGTINATNARTSAASQTAYNASGYLATITSQAENDFVAARLVGDGWIGGSDATVEGDWRWITGPENGTAFWSGNFNGSTVNGSYANWATGEPNDWSNGSPGEDCIQFYISNSQWNDLHCTNNTLAGYIVEFGAPGDLPEVTARNISITTNNAPTLSSLSPADNATNVTLNANAVVTFSQSVSKGTGNILIRKTSDNSIVETIDVTSSQVTGGGTSTITINPNITFDETTSYYITIPNTAFYNATNNYYAGISSTTAWNFTTGDFTNPSITNVTVSSITNTGATVTWTTSEQSSSRVSYGLTSSYGSQTSEINTSPRVTSHSVNLTGLLACTTYHIAAVSRDASLNSATSSNTTFTTTGCPAAVTPTGTISESIPVNSGGTTTLTENNTQLTVNVPSNVTTGTSTVVIQIKAVEGAPILNSYGKPTTSPREVGEIVFDVKAIINGTTELDSFDAPVTITYQYTDADIAGLNESTLWLYHYHANAWQRLDACTVSTATNTISCTTDSFSIFGLFGQSASVSTPPQPEGPRTCTAIAPIGSPNLFQIDTSHNQAKVYFSPYVQHVTNYFISYGYQPGEQRFGTFTGLGASTGVLSYTINHLAKNTTYYIRIQPFNDCQAGNWSNEMKFTTHNALTGGKAFYKSSPTHTLSLFPSPLKNLPSVVISQSPSFNILGATTNTCEYVVQPGDSLWTIALEKLGSGTKYIELMQENSLETSFIRTGKIIKVGC